MWIMVRALTYAALFVGLVLVFVPAQVLSLGGVVRPSSGGMRGAIAMSLATVGGLIALWCVWTFARAGRGTPAPFDPPRRLVVGGPYAFVRNPMYVGAGLALAGAALYYRSPALLGYDALLFAASHTFIVRYEEPKLRKSFGADYESYCRAVGRWWPRGRPYRRS